MPKFEKLAKLHKYGAAVSFLAMEIFALLAFSFSGNYILFGSLSLALFILLVIFNIRQIKVDGISSIAFFFLPLFLFALVTAFGVYMRSHADVRVGHFNMAELVFIPLGLIPMAFTGYILSIDKTFKISTFLIVIYGALAVLSLINLSANIVNFGFFYTIIYKGYHMYYGGEMSAVTVDRMAYVLEGFKIIEADISHYVLYPAMLLTSGIALLFISPLRQKKLFVIYSVFTGIALLSLIFVPTMYGLYSFVIVLLITAVIFLLKRFEVLRKPAGIVLYVGIGLASLVFLVMFANMNISGIHNVISGNGLLNRLFNTNGIVSRYNPLIDSLFSNGRFLGFVVTNDAMQEEVHMSGSFLFDSFMTSGVIGVIAIIVMMVVGFKGFKKYFLKENDDFYSKALLIAFVIFFCIYAGTINSTEYGIYYTIYKPVYMTGPFMLLIFIFCYVISKGEEKVETKKEPQAIEEVKQDE